MPYFSKCCSTTIGFACSTTIGFARLHRTRVQTIEPSPYERGGDSLLVERAPELVPNHTGGAVVKSRKARLGAHNLK